MFIALSKKWNSINGSEPFSALVQILQSIANHVLFTKEEHMRPFNDFVKSNFDAARRYVHSSALSSQLL